MGNQPGANQYALPQQQGSNIQQAFPYGSTPTSGNYQGVTPSAIINYYEKGHPTSNWPSITNLTQQSHLSQQNNYNFNGSYVNDPSAPGSQINYRGSQLNSNLPGTTYGNGIQDIQYGQQINFNPSYVNNKSNLDSPFNKKQRVSSIGQPQVTYQNGYQIPQNYSQIHPSQLQPQSQLYPSQMNSHLNNQFQEKVSFQLSPSQKPKSSIQPSNQRSNIPIIQSEMISNPEQFPAVSEVYSPSLKQQSQIIPSILQNKNHANQSFISANNQSLIEDKRISFTDGAPKSVQLIKANLKLAKDKFNKLATDNQSQLFVIMQQINSQVNQGILSKDRLIFLLQLKRVYERLILQIRMRQQKFTKILNEINTNFDPETPYILQNYNNQLNTFNFNFVPNWREIINTQNSQEFVRISSQGKNNPEVMVVFEKYNSQVQAAISSLPTPPSVSTSVMSVKSVKQNPPASYNYGGYTGNILNPTNTLNSMNSINSMGYSGVESHTGISQTARFPSNNFDPSGSRVSQNSMMRSSVRSSRQQQYGLNVVSPSQLHNTVVHPLPSSSNLLQSSIIPSDPFTIPQIISTKQSTKLQTPKIANYLQSKVVCPPPQYQPFVPPLPTASSFKT